MRRLLPIVVWLLAALWLPANLHCAVEFGGEETRTTCCADHGQPQPAAATGDHCAKDHCAVFDQGFPSQRGDELNLAPAAVAPFDLGFPPAATALPASIGTPAPLGGQAPPDVAASWSFERRAALPARAPSSAVS